MTRRGAIGILLVGAALTGCDKVSDKIPFLGKKQAATARAGTPAVQPAESPTPAPPILDTAKKAPAKPAPTPRPAIAAVDEPWTPVDTGTVTPGMTRDQVIGVWGAPVVERSRDKWSYLYFRNGCEASCGTFDVVFLENGQVVDAVVRGTGHTYGGNSSSPAGRTPAATIAPGLAIPHDPASPSPVTAPQKPTPEGGP